jgi:hypothetical protein
MSEQGQHPDVTGGGEAAVGGGRATRGPAIRPGGGQEPGGPTPPYEDRRERASDVDEEGRPPEADVNVGGATGPVRAEDAELTSEDPSQTPRGAHASPADEQPASEVTATEPDEGGVDLTAHTPGVPRGEELER